MPNRLRELREKAGLSQEALAYASGVSVATIRRCERGDTPTLSTAWAIAKTLKATVHKVWPAPEVVV